MKILNVLVSLISLVLTVAVVCYQSPGMIYIFVHPFLWLSVGIVYFLVNCVDYSSKRKTDE